MSKFLQFLAKEPAMVGGFLSSILPALAALGLVSLSADQIATIVVLINGAVAIAVRFKVYAAPNVPAPKA